MSEPLGIGTLVRAVFSPLAILFYLEDEQWVFLKQKKLQIVTVTFTALRMSDLVQGMF